MSYFILVFCKRYDLDVAALYKCPLCMYVCMNLFPQKNRPWPIFWVWGIIPMGDTPRDKTDIAYLMSPRRQSKRSRDQPLVRGKNYFSNFAPHRDTSLVVVL